MENPVFGTVSPVSYPCHLLYLFQDMIGLFQLLLDIASFRDVPILAEYQTVIWLHDALEVIVFSF